MNKYTLFVAGQSVDVLTSSARVASEVARLNRMFAEQGAKAPARCLAQLNRWVRGLHNAVLVGRLPTA